MDYDVPRNRSVASAQQRGFHDRLAGASVYANPYADELERRQRDGRAAGWLAVFLNAWWRGWRVADSTLDGRSRS